MSWLESIKKHIAALDELRRKHRSAWANKWEKELSRNHPCAFCLNHYVYRGRPCDDCQEKLNIWCPCEYSLPNLPARAPLPDYICSEICTRCGFRIKALCEAMDNDDEFERILADIERRNLTVEENP